jgi:hypothetical protein
LKELLLEIEDFAQKTGIEDSADEERPVLSPLQVPLELMPDKLKEYKALLTALYSKAKDLSNDFFPCRTNSTMTSPASVCANPSPEFVRASTNYGK